MDYELIDRAQRRAMLTDELRRAESQHYTEVLRRIANPKDRGIQTAVSDNIAKIEAGIAALRAELANYDDEAAPTATQPPAPGEVVSAVGSTVSEPENDTATP